MAYRLKSAAGFAEALARVHARVPASIAPFAKLLLSDVTPSIVSAHTNSMHTRTRL